MGSFTCTLIPSKASADVAQTNACNFSTVLTYTSIYTAKPDTYDVYVRMGKRSESAQSSLYYQSTDGTNCQTVGSVTATGVVWTKLGRLALTDGQPGTFTLASAQFQDVPGVNSPTILLVSTSNPVCQPTTECYVKVAGKQAVVHAAGNSLSDSTLHVVTATDPAKDKLERVDYYVDNTFAYTKPTIEPFDQHYISGGQHNLATVATYKSTQQLVITSSVNGGYVTDINYYVFTFWQREKFAIIFVGSIVLIIVVLESVLLIARNLYHKKMWDQGHGLSKSKKPSAGARILNRPYKEKFISIKGGLLIATCAVIAVGAMVILNTWVTGLYQVDGHSMESTYFTGNELLINKLSKTVDTLAGKQYLPKRGQAIVLIMPQDISFEPEESTQQTYLVKRVIGLPGERVTVKNGAVTIYNATHPNGFDPDSNGSWLSTMHFSTNDQIDVTLAPDEVFVCGDNRPQSVDSRTFGPVKLNEIVGNVAAKLTWAVRAGANP